MITRSRATLKIYAIYDCSNPLGFVAIRDGDQHVHGRIDSHLDCGRRGNGADQLAERTETPVKPRNGHRVGEFG